MEKSGKQRSKVEKRTESSPGVLHYHSNAQFPEAFKEMTAMRDSKDLCDVTFLVDGEKIYAHRVVLSSLSPYFKAMFTGDMAESKQKEITLNGIDANTLASLINYAYTANINITEDNVQLLLPAASILQFEEIRQVCSNFMQQRLTSDNCIGVRTFAEIHGCSRLESAASVFSQSHFTEVCQKDEFFQFTADQLKEMLAKDQLNTKSEFEVFQAAMSWIEQEKEERKQHLSDLMSQIRLPLLSAKELLQDVGKHPLVLGDPKCVRMLLEAVQFHMLPGSVEKVCEAMGDLD